jgi:CO/xanthine dehydrogenase Mo-binding subunit
MAAETLGQPIERVRTIIADTTAIGYSAVTGGSRVTFATGMAVVQAAEKIVKDLMRRAALIWDCPPEQVHWQAGVLSCSDPAKAGKFLTLKDIAGKTARTGGPISAEVSLTAQGAGPGFGVHLCDIELDPETGRSTVVRYTAAQDVGRAIHPSYVEGQIQGGVAQGVGWALNEAYLYNEKGELMNPGFLDYRMPVACDLPMIDTILIESAPNSRHPYGAKGVGEVPIVPPLAAVASALSHVVGRRLTSLPLSAPAMLEAVNARTLV